MAPRSRLVRVIDAQRGGLFPWVPVCLALGIGVYFALSAEPPVWTWAALTLGAGLGAGAVSWRGLTRDPLLIAAVLIVSGLLLAGARTHLVADTVLPFRYYGPVEGRIVAMDRSASDAVRLTLDRVVLTETPPHRTPGRVRVSLHGDHPGTDPVPGKRVLITGHLSAPEGPVEPGGFDFQRMAWFNGLGAVGYARSPLVAVAPPEGGARIARWRMAISAAVRAHLPGEVGAFAAAITTGDRASMSQTTLADLRASNLAHLLAISGLHMGLLTGLVFAGLRTLCALVPALALEWPIKKIAAVGALSAGAVYLALSGGNVATQRAFIMVAVMFVAVLLDRRALTLRAVAVAATIVLLLRPESLLSPGFQMSFAATTALVAVFRGLQGIEVVWVPKWLRPVLAVVLSSAVAGAATAPIGAAHFNTVSHFGLLANVLSVPLMGTIVMPGAILAAALAPFGAEGLGLAVMEPAIRWILGVAHWIAAQPGATGHVVAPGEAVLPVLALGALWVVIWRGRGRWLGVAPVICALVAWSLVERPALLISPSGGLVGVMTDAGRALNKPRGDGFVARSWLENDGDRPFQEGSAARAGFTQADGILRFRVAGQNFAHLSGRGAVDRLDAACASADIVILAAEAPGTTPDDCALFDRKTLRAAGGMALRVVDGRPTWQMSIESTGQRPWTPRRRAVAHRLPDLVAQLEAVTAP